MEENVLTRFLNQFLKFLCLSLFLTSSLQSSDDLPYLTSECDVLALVEGVVNAYNGKLVQIDQDIRVDGYDPLELTRTYDGGHHFASDLGYGFGDSYPILLTLFRAKDDYYAKVELRTGLEVLCKLHKEKKLLKGSVAKEYFKCGYTNSCQSLFQGEPSLYALQVEVHDQDDAPHAIVTLGDGTKRWYHLFGGEYGVEYYRLFGEQRSNKNIRSYYYHSDTIPLLRSVVTKNGDESLELNRIDFSYKEGEVLVKASNGQKAHYTLEETKGKITRNKTLGRIKGGLREYLLVKAKIDDAPSKKYNYLTHTHSRHTLFSIDQVHEADGRFLKVKLDSNQRVKELHQAGCDEPLYTFDYHSDYTLVTDAAGAEKRFEFSKRRLTKLVEVHRTQKFQWDEKGQLTQHTLFDPEGNLVCKRSYDYDEKGNILELKLTGCIKEQGNKDTATVKYTYTKENNRLKTETHDQLEYRYRYLPKTILPTSKLTFYKGKCVEREFHDYDKNGILICTIADDGASEDKEDFSHVTYRRVTEIEPQLNPKEDGLTLPRTITEFYIDPVKKKKHLLKRIERSYAGDLLTEERIFDSHNEFKYRLKFKYNDRRELISETNALGEETKYAYDESGNKIQEILVGSGKEIHFKYDLANRLIEETEYHPTGEKLTKTYVYDAIGNRISSTDIYGQETQYQFDLAGREIGMTDPLGGQESKEYDSLGNVTKSTDKNGHCTETHYNISGKPLLITHPDGTTQKYAYNIQGHLIQEWFRDRTYVTHEVDYRGRITQSTFHDKDGAVLKSCSYRYKGENLISETDPLGRVTEYRYDGAGRKIARIDGDITTTYKYDSLGHLSRTKRSDRIDLQEYDFLDRLVEERVEDSQGNIFSKKQYAYDRLGNLILERIYRDGSHFSEIKTVFNTQNFPIKRIDPLGNVTELFYTQKDHLETLTIDPLGRQTLEIFDPLNRLKEQKILSRTGLLVARCTFAYDKRGNQTLRQDDILHEGLFQGTHRVEAIYDAMGHKTQEVEQGMRTLQWSYKAGRLKKHILADGTAIKYTYDPLGRLSQQESSDGSVLTSFSYDLNDNLLEAQDLVHQTLITRQYDSHDRLIHEKQATGFQCSYAYDELDRLLNMTWGNESIAYTYSPTALVSSKRFKNGKQLYTCSETRDWRGKLLSSTYPSQQTVAYTWDAAGRCTAIQSQPYQQKLKYDSVGNLVSSTTTDPLGTNSTTYSYDPLNQLLEENGAFTNVYKLDSIHNRHSQNDISYKHNSLNELLHSGDDTYSYDANGRRLTKNDAHYTYDALGHLIQYKDPEQLITYTYDALGRLITKNAPDGGQQRFFYQFDTEMGSSTPSHSEFRLLHGKHATQIIELDDQIYTALRNHRGDICLLLNSQNTSTIRYDAFGNFLHDGPLPPWLFSSQRFDPATHFYLYAKRSYDPAIGRWLTPDPLLFADGSNLFDYVHNNPLIYIDPYGLWREEAKDFFHSVTRGAIDDTTWGASTLVCGEHIPRTTFGTVGYHIGTVASMGAGLFYGGTWAKLGIKGGYTLVKTSIQKTASSSLGKHYTIKEITKNADKFAAHKVAEKASIVKKSVSGKSPKITDLEKKISEWLGENSKMIKNKSGDPIFISEDAKRRVRFDFLNPHGEKPHMHIEIKPNNNWKNATSEHRIFPKINEYN